jgi:polyphenol oxidase
LNHGEPRLDGFLRPRWPAPPGVQAVVTLREAGAEPPSGAPWQLARQADTDRDRVQADRSRLVAALGLPGSPRWLRQEHGRRVAEAADGGQPVADACIGRARGEVCAILTADCLPVLLCDREATVVGAAHAGWRGLAAGVVEAAVAACDRPPERLLAWLGPAIGPGVYEVGEEVREALLAGDGGAGDAFRPSPRGRWLADLYHLARRRLATAGVRSVHGGGLCTFSDARRFHSHRRDGGAAGRMASLVWLGDADPAAHPGEAPSG